MGLVHVRISIYTPTPMVAAGSASGREETEEYIYRNKDTDKGRDKSRWIKRFTGR